MRSHSPCAWLGGRLLFYGDFVAGGQVKILPNPAFGYQRITVEQPLRLRWEITPDTGTRLAQSSQWAKLSTDEQDALAANLEALSGTTTTDQTALARKLGSSPKIMERSLWELLAVRDSDAPVITNKKREPEPDADLRDNENIPLPDFHVSWQADVDHRLASLEYRSAVDDYMTTEVTPYIPDAWVDHTKTKLGYEIPLTRHFYEYTPPRPLAAIDAEIKALETEIQNLLGQVTA